MGRHVGPAAIGAGTALRWGAQLLAAVVVAHLVLAGGTLAATGELPDWGWYLNTLREFLVGPIGDLTYDFTSFSPGLAVGGAVHGQRRGRRADRGAPTRPPRAASGRC